MFEAGYSFQTILRTFSLGYPVRPSLISLMLQPEYYNKNKTMIIVFEKVKTILVFILVPLSYLYVNHSITKSKLAAELGPAQPQLVFSYHLIDKTNTICLLVTEVSYFSHRVSVIWYKLAITVVNTDQVSCKSVLCMLQEIEQTEHSLKRNNQST